MSLSQNPRFGSKNYPILSKPISAASTTQTVVPAVPAVAGGPGSGLPGYPAQTIAVLGFTITSSAAGATATFQSSTGPTNLTGALDCGQYGSLKQDIQDVPLFQTAPGDALNLTSTGGTITGWVNYVLLPGTSTY